MTIILLKDKAKLTRELSEARGESRETAATTVDYEDIELVQQIRQGSAAISTRDNVAYGHVRSHINN